jgi:hypothetical protein
MYSVAGVMIISQDGMGWGRPAAIAHRATRTHRHDTDAAATHQRPLEECEITTRKRYSFFVSIHDDHATATPVEGATGTDDSRKRQPCRYIVYYENGSLLFPRAVEVVAVVAAVQLPEDDVGRTIYWKKENCRGPQCVCQPPPIGEGVGPPAHTKS